MSTVSWKILALGHAVAALQIHPRGNDELTIESGFIDVGSTSLSDQRAKNTRPNDYDQIIADAQSKHQQERENLRLSNNWRTPRKPVKLNDFQDENDPATQNASSATPDRSHSKHIETNEMSDLQKYVKGKLPGITQKQFFDSVRGLKRQNINDDDLVSEIKKKYDLWQVGDQVVLRKEAWDPQYSHKYKPGDKATFKAITAEGKFRVQMPDDTVLVLGEKHIERAPTESGDV